jgi:acyl dehydratase
MDFKIFKTLIRNVNSYEMNRDLVGYSFEEITETIKRDQAIEFAEATKDNNPIYHEGDLAPPFFVNKLIFPMLKTVMCHSDLRMNLLRMVHAEQEMVWHNPIKVGSRLQVKMEIKEIYDTPVGEMIKINARGYDDVNPVIEGIIGLIVRNKTKPGKKKATDKVEAKEKFRIHIQTEDGQQLKYAKISGDNNSIHTNNLLAKMAGLPRTIMHGAGVLAMICASLIEKQLDFDIKRLKSIRGQFRKPAIPGEMLTLIAYEPSKTGEIPFDVYNPTGNIVFQNGIFGYK